MKDTMRITSVVAALVVGLVFATTASAQQASQDGYRNAAGQIQSGVNQGGGEGPTNAAAVSDDGGSLPFTGFDLALLAGAGGLLVAAGVGMRRLTRVPDSV
jgi:hypothetical protein